MEEVYMRHRLKFVPVIVVTILMLIFIFAFNLGWMAPVILIFLSIPVLLFCFIRHLHPTLGGMRGLPADATPIHPPERDEILRELAGQWDIIPTGGAQPAISMHNISFSKAYVTGDNITLSGGPNGRVQNQKIFLSRTPAGTLYLDNLGSFVSTWDKVAQEIHINNALNMQLIWRRPQGGYQGNAPAANYQQPVAPVFHQPVAAVVQPPPAQGVREVLVLPSWWETMTDPSGRVYYKNSYKMTTSWTPPTAQQIADETRERNAAAVGEGEGQEGLPPPPAYNPAYKTTNASAPPPY